MKDATPKGPTLRQFQQRFPTEDSCLDHLMRVRYGAKHTCAKCEREARYYRVKARRSFECEYCGHQVYPTAGTPFEKTRTSLRDWFYVMFLFTTSRNGVAAKRVQREIGVTYKTAWRMCHLIRHYMGYVDGDDALGGPDGKPVEIDHAFIGGFSPGKTGQGDKMVVLGMVETGGNVITTPVNSISSGENMPIIMRAVKAGSSVTTDTATSFQGLARTANGYDHKMVNHLRKERVREGRTTNTIEGYWSLLKRGINGTYIAVSAKHLPKYLAEFEFRYNLRKHPHIMFDLLLQSFPRGA
ncbi:MAG TPA: IS1595 family transposase [Brevundimonas sp.]|jgi:transposase-like protein/ribosomal protein L37AE/L43A|uniref:IS1595 family transposase n=1 Tax=Brevundimonas sp. TaxID=1871086 RepID=UPI002DE26C37|nr:IS1595 family transposase [Brevundimonas sp.]